MGVMQRLADAPSEMGVGRGDEHSLGGFGLVFDRDDASQRVFAFDTGLFITSGSENLVSMLGDKLTGEQQDSARCAVAYPFTGRAYELMNFRWDGVPGPPAFVVDRFALTTDRRFLEFTLRLVRVVQSRSN